jgi:ribosomal protein S18 acetylase RimI-like enzyme
MKAFNESKIGPYSRRPFTISVVSSSKIIAGLVGDIFGPLCNIYDLWVDEQLRQKGLGSKMIKQIETFAKSRNCKIIQLYTAEFHARGFYEKLGYAVMATHPGEFMGHDVYVMRHAL